MNDNDNDNDISRRLGEAIEPAVPPVDPSRLAAIRALAQATATGSPVAPMVASRRSLLRMGVAAAGGIAAGAAGFAIVSRDWDDDPAGPPMEAASVRPVDGVQASANLINHTWGTEVLLDVSGLEPGAAYTMDLMAADGRRVSAGGFVGADGVMKCRNNGAVLRADLQGFAVTGPGGTEVLSAELN